VNRRVILTSTLTAPERIKPHLRGGMWIYAGKDLNRFHAFKKCLGKETIHASPAQFREFTISNRNAFVKWSEEIHLQYRKNLTHWLSDTFSSNPYMSNLFFYFMNLARLRFILNKYPREDIIFVAESHALLLIANAISSKDKGNGIYKYGFNKERIRTVYRMGVSILSGYRSFIRFFVRYLFLCVYSFSKQGDNLQKVSVIIDSYIFEDSFDKNGKFTNKYFSELHECLSANGFTVGVLGIFYNISLKRIKFIFKSIYRGETKFVLLENCLTLIDYVTILIYPLKRLGCFEKVHAFLGIDVQPLVNEENLVKINSPNSISALLLHKLPRRLHEKGINPDVYINWSENQLIHRGMISGVYKYLRKTKVIGGKPFCPPLNHLNLFNTTSERVSGYAPDIIVTCGRELKDMLSAFDNESYYVTGPSFRYNYLRKYVDDNHFSENSRLNHRIVSIVLPQSILISKHVLVSTKKAVRNAMAGGWEIKVKLHPTLTESDVAMLLNEYDMQHECIEVTYDDMESLLTKSSAVLISASGATIEAVCLGIPVVAVGMPIGLDLNMLDYLPSSMWKLAFTDVDIDLVLNEWALSHPLTYEERREIGRKVFIDIFGEDTNSSLQIYLELLEGL
jgi:hypothetical protein